MKKLMSLLLGSAMVVSLAGCAQSKEAATTTKSEETTVQEAQAATQPRSESTTVSDAESSNEASAKKELTDEDLLDREVVIPEDTRFLEMDPTEKAKKYAELDLINRNTLTEVPATKFSQVKEITSEDEYKTFIEKSNEEAMVLYLGFDECPYCRVFIPKLNHLATELKVELNYYNTNHRVEDPNFQDVIRFLNVETVPHAFIIEKGEVKAIVNHTSTMQDLEDFLKKLVEMNQ